MDIFNKYISDAAEILNSVQVTEFKLCGKTCGISDKNTFLMEKDTSVELGGYPKESVNLCLPTSGLSSTAAFAPGIYCIGDPLLLTSGQKQLSFGKVVLLETDDIPDDKLYDLTQDILMTDSRTYMKDIMVRQSPAHYNIDLRVGKKAIAEGLDLRTMAETIYSRFNSMENVHAAAVVLLIGDSPVYKKLLPVAERAKELTITLNHIFDGFEMDCRSCDFTAICDEVESLRKLHNKSKKRSAELS